MKSAVRRCLSWLYGRRFAKSGSGLVISPFGSHFRGHKKIFIGDRVHIGPGAHFSVHMALKIDDDVLIGPEVMILSGSHPIENLGETINTSSQGVNASCTIERDSWLAARTTVIGGVKIGEGSVVGANSLVLCDLPPYTVSVGVPCRPLRKRFSDDELCRHLMALGRGDEAQAIMEKRNSILASFGF